MTRDELIAALEKATGADRDLDANIGKVAGWLKTGWAANRWWAPDVAARARKAKKTPGSFGVLPLDLPKFTASIDAALTLVPDDACWGVSRPRQPDMSGKQFWASIHGGHPGGRGATPSIALCIAALKARPE